ncbi:MAG: hypothetical protein JNK87_16760 [Bryobacterales bacterium]|nr:hypothetical protein [Bryobacterales bacterium]
MSEPFGLALTQRVAEEHPRRNVILSPMSIAMALSMAEAGAQGETRTAIAHTLRPSGQAEAPVSSLLGQLRQRSGVDLRIANALWSDRRFALAPAYVARCRREFEADATTLDFDEAQRAADAINAWVSQRTEAHIPAIVSPRQVESSLAILTNALYFQARWLHPFPPVNTRPLPFQLASGETREAAFLQQSGLRGAYRKGPGFEAAELPYGQSGVSLYALLPATGTPPEALLAGLNVDQLLHTTEAAELELLLPRLTLDGSFGLKSALAHLGMGVAFRYPGADFSPLGSREFFLGDVLHNTHIAIDEQGTVAAAATAVLAPTGAAPVRVERKRLLFDRPFAFVILDHASRALLFTGVVYEP